MTWKKSDNKTANINAKKLPFLMSFDDSVFFWILSCLVKNDKNTPAAHQAKVQRKYLENEAELSGEPLSDAKSANAPQCRK